MRRGLPSPVTGAFLAAGRADGCVLWLSPKARVPLLDCRRRLGAAPLAAPVPLTLAEALVGRVTGSGENEPLALA